MQNLKKEFLEWIQNYEDVPFGGQDDPFAANKKFLVKIIIIIFIYLLTTFIVQNFKKFFKHVQSYEDAPFLDPK